MAPTRHFTGSSWEPKVGYCRALRQGPHVWIAGCAPVARGGGIHAPGQPYPQAVRCLEIIVEALAAVGARPEHVVRTRMFVTDGARWEEYGRAHAEVFAAHPPVATMVEVAGFVDPAMTIEIEAEAYVPAARRRRVTAPPTRSPPRSRAPRARRRPPRR